MGFLFYVNGWLVGFHDWSTTGYGLADIKGRQLQYSVLCLWVQFGLDISNIYKMKTHNE